jgi:hypothetical protein
LQPHRYESGPGIDLFVSKMENGPDIFSVHQTTLSNYAQRTVRVVRVIEGVRTTSSSAATGRKAPSPPGQHPAQGRALFAFDGAYPPGGSARILDDLRRIVPGTSGSAKTLRISVLDAAVGGDGCRVFAGPFWHWSRPGSEGGPL